MGGKIATEWAAACQGWSSLNRRGKKPHFEIGADHSGDGDLMCCNCADAYAREQVEAFRERAAVIAEMTEELDGPMPVAEDHDALTAGSDRRSVAARG